VSRVPPTPVEVRVLSRWYRGTLRSCEVSEDGATCTGVVSFHVPHGVQTGRFPATHMRSPAGTPGCPADHVDQTCGAGARASTTAMFGQYLGREP